MYLVTSNNDQVTYPKVPIGKNCVKNWAMNYDVILLPYDLMLTETN